MYLVANAGADVTRRPTLAATGPSPRAGGGPGGNLFMSGHGQVGNSIVANGAGPAGSENCISRTAVPRSASTSTASTSAASKRPATRSTRTRCSARCSSTAARPDHGPGRWAARRSTRAAPSGLTTDQRGLTAPDRPADDPELGRAGADGSDIGAVELQLPPPQQLSNAFTLGKLTRNKKKGTARLAGDPAAALGGDPDPDGQRAEETDRAIAGETEVKLNRPGKKKLKKALRKKGKRKVEFNVTYTPTGNPAATKSRKVKLVKKKKKSAATR